MTNELRERLVKARQHLEAALMHYPRAAQATAEIRNAVDDIAAAQVLASEGAGEREAEHVLAVMWSAYGGEIDRLVFEVAEMGLEHGRRGEEGRLMLAYPAPTKAGTAIREAFQRAAKATREYFGTPPSHPAPEREALVLIAQWVNGLPFDWKAARELVARHKAHPAPEPRDSDLDGLTPDFDAMERNMKRHTAPEPERDHKAGRDFAGRENRPDDPNENPDPYLSGLPISVMQPASREAEREELLDALVAKSVGRSKEDDQLMLRAYKFIQHEHKRLADKHHRERVHPSIETPMRIMEDKHKRYLAEQGYHDDGPEQDRE